MNKMLFLACAGCAGALLAAPAKLDAAGVAVKTFKAGELLYNGIELPKAWPPRDVPADGRSELVVPYLGAGRPDVAFIDVGRQLFVDDFLVEKTDLARVYNHPVKYAGNPVLKPENDYERHRPQNAIALPKGGGMWWDAERKVFRLW